MSLCVAVTFLQRSYQGCDRLRVSRVIIKKLFQIDMDTTVARYKLMQNAKLYRGVAIVVPDEIQERIVAAQAADELLNISGVEASVVASPDGTGGIYASARSIGNMNVQILFSLAVIWLAGFLFTRVTRLFNLPNVTGYILSGVLIGPWVLGIIPDTVRGGMGFVTDAALCFIAFDVGRYLHRDRLKTGGRGVLLITVMEAFLAAVIVTLRQGPNYRFDGLPEDARVKLLHPGTYCVAWKRPGTWQIQVN